MFELDILWCIIFCAAVCWMCIKIWGRYEPAPLIMRIIAFTPVMLAVFIPLFCPYDLIDSEIVIPKEGNMIVTTQGSSYLDIRTYILSDNNDDLRDFINDSIKGASIKVVRGDTELYNYIFSYYENPDDIYERVVSMYDSWCNDGTVLETIKRHKLLIFYVDSKY
mgnify:FL=1